MESARNATSWSSAVPQGARSAHLGRRALPEEQEALAVVMAGRAKRMMDEAGRDRYERRRAIATASAEVLRRLLVERD